MGNKHNTKNTHISRGKFKKRKAIRKTGQVKLLNDNRIISLHQLQQQVEVIANHTASCMSYNEILINEQKREGLASLFTIHCNGCSEDFTLATSVKVKGPSGHQYWENNLAAVWGQMSTGGGHATLQETMSVLGLPTMTKKSFMATERRIGEWWWNHLQESMKSAGEMEKTIAISQNRYHQGVPAITVIVDGGWSKRSHKHSYNAKSGVGIIIGKATGKILYMGVRNKYCAVCYNKAYEGNPLQHTCFLNWNGSSSAMEADIILDGFRNCEEQHGVRYIEFIGDGDSSVYPTLISSIPWGYAIKKLECANHAVKCYRSALENLVHNNPAYKGKGKLTESMRKKLTKAARSAIIMRSQEEDRPRAISKLQKGLINSPLHCFGCHEKCSPDFCKTVQQSNDNTTASSDLPHTSLTSQLSLPSQLSSSSQLGSLPSESNPSSDNSNSSADISSSSSDLMYIFTEQQGAWADATSNEGLEEVRVVPTIPPHNIDMAMLCDIQRVVSRLVEKASQLIGNIH